MNKLKITYIIISLGYLLSALVYKLFSLTPFIFNGIGFLIAILITLLIKQTLKKVLEFKTLYFTGISLFLFIVLIPLCHKTNNDNATEKRALTKLPEFNPSNPWLFTGKIVPYFEDDFAFRSNLLKFYSKIKVGGFKTSPNPYSVSIEKNGWQFLCEPDYIEQSSSPYSKEQLAEIVNNIKATNAFFKYHGIKYYLTIPPIKPRIYPEFLSDRYANKFKYSRLDQISKALANENCLIDLRPNILAHKKTAKLYYETDTHWNRLGAFYGYQTILKRIQKDFPSIKPIKFSDVDTNFYTGFGGDLNKLMGDKTLMKRTIANLTLKNREAKMDCSAVPFYEKVKVNNPFIVMRNNRVKKKMLMFRDSYTQYLYPLLSEHFETSIYAWRPDIHVGLVNHEKPDLIIHEILERFVDFLLVLPPEIEQFKLDNKL